MSLPDCQLQCCPVWTEGSLKLDMGFWRKPLVLAQGTGKRIFKENERIFLSLFWFPSGWRTEKGSPGTRRYWGHGREEGVWGSDLIKWLMNSWAHSNGTCLSLTPNIWDGNTQGDGPPLTSPPGHQGAHTQDGSEERCEDWRWNWHWNHNLQKAGWHLWPEPNWVSYLLKQNNPHFP